MSESKDGAGQFVLIVDDEPMARTLLRLMLVRSGFDVAEAKDGFDALEKVQKRCPDVMVLDVMMPKEGGIQMYRELKDRDDLKDVPVIMVSTIDKKTF